MQLYNTFTRKSEQVVPLEAKEIKLYTCGLTVYSQPHIGNWVTYIYWDILVRALRASGYDVNHVQNITDVGHLTSDEDAGEDKMLKSALKEGKTAWEVAEKYIKVADHEGFDLLGLNKPSHMPRATDFIPEQIAFIKELEKKGFTYTIADGVYFDTSKLPDYGKLARLDIKGLQFGARVEDTGKKTPTDFALWKFSDVPANDGHKRDMEWDSPWGVGFPGWHIECSVMARALLGEQIDIHTGGIEHIPVHHTNEIAQTEAVTGKRFSNFWLHANHIKVNGTKMSKSLGNVYTLQDIIDKGYDIEAFKLLVLSKHYRTEGNFTWEILAAAQNRLKNWQSVSDLRWQPNETTTVGNLTLESGITKAKSDFLSAIQNDLDTPGALSRIDSFFSAVELRSLLTDEVADFESLLRCIADTLGINLMKADISEDQKQLIKNREAAREAKEWTKSDEIREQLEKQGIAVRDTGHGQIWSRT